MKVLVVGSGGREHAIVWKLAQSPKVTKLYCAPGNGGIAELAECVNIKATDIDAIVRFAEEEDIDLTVVAPDDPLALGMVNALEKAGRRAFGPTAEAALIEASKSFSKQLMKKYGIPTADFNVFDSEEEAIKYLEQADYPIVVKADGLALGKGVIIAEDKIQAAEAVRSMMSGGKFGKAGSRVVIEEYMTGPEVSVLCFTDGKTIVPMVSSQDHKRALDNDKGLNTGGMGTFSPSLHYTAEHEKFVREHILQATVDAMNSEGRPFKGVLYFGLMLTPKGVKVLEYNARFGDPETQVVLPRLQSDLYEIFEAVIDGRLAHTEIKWNDKAAVCVVMASGGYPQSYETGFEITGLPVENAIVFHAGTKLENGKLVTAGGRVLGVTALGEDIADARTKAYDAVSKIHFKNAHYRHDIGIK
ncbi:MAG TPA: phosphoribosylamine--glycine ligase [Firmicutes bacterium]|nr:phosphoribosylamine--glycine ligase [Bacillota bacterium]